MVEDVRNLMNRGLVSRDAYASFIKKFNPQFGAAPAQAAPAESKAGKKVSAPLDVRPPAARNKPKPHHAKPKHSKFAKRAGHNPPKPEFSVDEEPGPFSKELGYKYDDTPTMAQRERERAAGKLDAYALRDIGRAMESPEGLSGKKTGLPWRNLPRMR